jgi:hypothetical protein
MATSNQPIPGSTPNTAISAAAGMNFSLMDYISALSLIAPFLLAFSMVMISVINSNIKGLIYLAGLFILFCIVAAFQYTLKVPVEKTNGFCNFIATTQYSVPSFNSALYLYTIIYVLFPMIQMGMVNFPLIIVFLILYVSDCTVKYKNKCSSMVGIVMGSILGLFFGISWFIVIRATGQNGLLYYDDLVSNKIACSRPTKQNFKCQVYKNGELIQNI